MHQQHASLVEAMSEEYNPFLETEDDKQNEPEEAFTHVVPAAGHLPATSEAQNGLIGSGNNFKDSSIERVWHFLCRFIYSSVISSEV